jgi:hypothetical protein
MSSSPLRYSLAVCLIKKKKSFLPFLYIFFFIRMYSQNCRMRLILYLKPSF